MESGPVEDKSATLIGVVMMLLFIATLVVVLRLWTRYFILNQLGADDYLALVSLVRQAFLGSALGQQLTRRNNRTRYGLGKHVSAINLETVTLYFKLTFLAHYYRLLAIQEMKRVYKAAIFIVGGWALSQVLVGIFICWPVQGFWDKTVNARRIPNQPQWYINAAGNIVTDIMVFLLPIPAIRSLRLPRNQKFILAGIFSLGLLCAALLFSSTAIANFASTVILSAIRIEYLQEFEDFSWKYVESNLWSMAELTSALICASLPTLRPFATRYLPALASKLARSTGRYGRGHGSRIHSSSGAYNLGRDNKSSKSVVRGADQLFHDNGATFEMQHHYSSDEIGYSRHRSDEDLVGGWEAGGIKTGAVASVRDVPSRGIGAETNRV
ncbi:integral membrane [Fusarium albosuccineum]|uniref:Integral membrane n=1 Tax=Fusarium albosuccineum TaxID=1237068 RepID=A0A8H4PFM1_9HYPO|nr:integral membrane [Fusarium albosuccineum]